MFAVVHDFECLLLGSDELVGCVGSAVYSVMADDGMFRCLVGLVVLGYLYV